MTTTMKLKPLVEALGMNPAWWMHRFTFISKQVWYDEKVSRLRFDHRQKQRDEIAGMIIVETNRMVL